MFACDADGFTVFRNLLGDKIVVLGHSLVVAFAGNDEPGRFGFFTRFQQ